MLRVSYISDFIPIIVMLAKIMIVFFSACLCVVGFVLFLMWYRICVQYLYFKGIPLPARRCWDIKDLSHARIPNWLSAKLTKSIAGHGERNCVSNFTFKCGLILLKHFCSINNSEIRVRLIFQPLISSLGLWSKDHCVPSWICICDGRWHNFFRQSHCQNVFSPQGGCFQLPPIPAGYQERNGEKILVVEPPV